jgi:hypothetical protein
VKWNGCDGILSRSLVTATPFVARFLPLVAFVLPKIVNLGTFVGSLSYENERAGSMKVIGMVVLSHYNIGHYLASPN